MRWAKPVTARKPIGSDETCPGSQPAPTMVPAGTLLAAARPLLNAIAHLRFQPPPADAAALRQQLIEGVRRFEAVCQADSLAYEVIIGARYCLCTSVDEAVALTEWGNSSLWLGNGLLLAFHNETNGGEKFFQLLAILSRDAARHGELLELIYYCLLLGFGGRYRAMENGLAQLATITRRLGQQLRKLRDDPPALQSTALLPPAPVQSPARSRALLPLALLLGLLALGSLYVTLDARLDQHSNQLMAEIYSLPLPNEPPAVEHYVAARLQHVLADELASGKATLSTYDHHLVLSLQGGDLFASGSAKLNTTYPPLIGRIARQLRYVPGLLQVRGYSDSQALHAGAFASNNALALARAQSVARLLQLRLGNARPVLAQSAAGEPGLLPETSAANRAINRRIEIIFTMAVEDNDADRSLEPSI